MFCPSCGFEYTQKTNFCKRCGESLSVPTGADAPKTPRSKIAGMFWAVAVFCVLGLVTVLNTYDHLVGRGAQDRKSTRLNSSHLGISYAVFCLKKKKTKTK